MALRDQADSKHPQPDAFIQGNFLILIITWILMNFTGPIPQKTCSSLYFKGLGAIPLSAIAYFKISNAAAKEVQDSR
jgi:quinol-cytochrome oxidoreductase complex cytochrome b subunit